MLDYILNVAVGIAAGVGALVSAVPSLQPHILALCLVILALITLVNLRGVRESGTAFLIPTYLFLAMLGLILMLGTARSLLSGGHPHAVEMPPVLPAASGGVTLWLLMRAFANGCTAMTGVEAISNAIPAFAAPVVRNARRTLTAVIALLGALLAGIAYLCQTYGIGATDPNGTGYQSVLSQLSAAVVGRGIVYYATMGSIIAVVCLSANTSFADFPRLCRLLALDNYLPYGFAVRGRRLVYSQGIVILAVIAGLLLIAFGGITDRLIPLFAIGAFGAFTLNQTGMVQHWRRELALPSAKPRMRLSLAINATGAALTFLVLLIVLATKFVEGAWLVVILVGALFSLFIVIRRHYDGVAAQTAVSAPLSIDDIKPPIVIVVMRQWSHISEKALRFALSLSTDVVAIHITSGEDQGEHLKRKWDCYVDSPLRASPLATPRLMLVQSPFRRFFNPLFATLRQIEVEHPGRMLAVIVPELVGSHWYDYLLHNQLSTALKAALLLRGNDCTCVINVPWYLDAHRLRRVAERVSST